MIISFYSYKGGVGRSQLCANVAAYLCYQKGKKVLLWDWDFEAPGLHYFFNKTNEDVNKKGTLEIVEEYAEYVRKSAEVKSTDLKYITKEDNIIPLVKEKNGCVDLLAAGNYNDNFSGRSNSFDWFEFYSMLDGVNYIEKLKESLNNLRYDYVLVDSRTGISDYSGICNIQLPEINVIVVAPTMQNFEGSKSIIEKIKTAEYLKIMKRTPRIFPILSRLDRSNPKYNEWVQRFTQYFSELIMNLDSNLDKEFLPDIFADIYFKTTFLPYTPAISAGENVMFSDKSLNTRTDYSRPFLDIAEYLDTFNHDRTLNFYRRVDEVTWQEYAKEAEDRGNRKKASIAYDQIAKMQIETTTQEAVLRKKIELEAPEPASVASAHESRKSRASIWPYMIIALLALIIIGYVWIRESRSTSADPNVTNTDSTLIDSLDKFRAYYDFVQEYNTSISNFEYAYAVNKLEKFYALDKIYQDSADDIKTTLEGVVANNMRDKIAALYKQLQNNKINLDTLVADSVMVVNKPMNKTALEKKLKTFRANNKITNQLLVPTFKLATDTSGFVLTYEEKGNVLLDRQTEYESIRLQDTVKIGFDEKIYYYNYVILDSVSKRMRVQVFYNLKSVGYSGQRALQALQNTRDYIVMPKNNFNPSSDPNSYYYITTNEIRYFEPDELDAAKKLQTILEKATYTTFQLRPTSTRTQNSISIFIVQNRPVMAE